jgi:hypothetical protein
MTGGERINIVRATLACEHAARDAARRRSRAGGRAQTARLSRGEPGWYRGVAVRRAGDGRGSAE